MANQQNSLERSDGSGTDSRDFSYTFPTFKESEVKVEVDNVVKTLTTHYTIVNHNNSSGGTVRFNATGLPDGTASTTPIRIFRQTDVDTPKAEFTAGSALKAQEINDNFKQVRHALQEAIGATYDNSGNPTSRQVQRYNIEADAIDGTLIADDVINSEHYAAGSIDLEHMSANSVDSDQYVDGSIDRIHLEADIIDGSKIEDNAVDNEHIATDAVRTDEIQNNAVTMAKLGSGALPTDITIASDNLVNGTIVNADVNTSAAIDGTKVTPDFGSQNVATTGTAATGALTVTGDISVSGTVDSRDVAADGSKLDGIEVGATADQTDAQIKAAYENNANTNAYTDTEKTFVNAITSTATELNYVDGVTSNVQTQLDGKQPVDAELTELATMANNTAHALADLTQAEVQALDGITATTAELNLNDGQTATPTEVNILDGATVTTNELNILDGVTANKDEINLLDGKTVVTTIASNATDTQLPSAQAVNERITTVVQDVGGFVPIANETSFPTDNPDLDNAAGTIVSIKALNSAFTTGSGVTTKTFSNGAGTGKNVTITGLTANTTYSAGRGLILETTQYSGGGRGGDANEYEYAFHRLTLDEAGVSNADALVTNFNERYYGPFSANQATRPSGANRQNGDLYFNTSDGKMKVFNGSHGSGTWDDVAAPGNFFINTISSSSGSGGGSATFNGTATRFTLSNPPLTAQQLLVSINGVVQKPNSGTSPSEGFAIDGADIIFAAAPNSGAPYFIVTIGSSVNIGTPSDGTVTSAKIVDGTIVNADISSSAAIARTKLANVDLVDDTSPQLGGNLDVNGHQILLNDDENIRFGNGANAEASDFRILHTGGVNVITSDTGTNIRLVNHLTGGNETMAQFIPNGAAELYYNGVKKFETTSAGATITGDLSLGDNKTIRLGDATNGDFRIIHGGTNTTLRNLTGQLQLRSDALCFENNDGSDFATVTGIKFGDNNRAKFGTGDDLQIYHDGSKSIINEGGTGWLEINTNNLRVQNAAANETLLYITENGSVQLYYDNSPKLVTTSAGIEVTGRIALMDASDNAGSGNALWIGSGNDLKIYHDGTHSRIHNNTGLLLIEGDGNIEINSGASTAHMAKFVVGGAAELYHNGGLKINTHTNGLTIKNHAGGSSSTLYLIGSEGQSAEIQMNADDGDDNADYFRLIHLASDNSWRLENYGGGSWEKNIVALTNGAVELYHDNNKVFETLTAGIKVQRLTATNSYIEMVNSGGVAGYLYGSGNSEIHLMDREGHQFFKGIKDGAAELYYDNTKRIETKSDGAQVNGVSHIRSEDSNSVITEKAFYYSIGTNSSVTVTLTGLIGTGTFTAGGYTNAGQGALGMNIVFGGAMFATQHYNVNVVQNSAMQNTSTSLQKNGTSYVITISNSSNTYSLNAHFGLKSQGAEMGLAFS